MFSGILLLSQQIPDLGQQQLLGRGCGRLGLGGGLGRMREVCGAVSGAALVFGLVYGDDKTLTYAKVQEFCARFKKETGSVICRELLEGAKVQVETGGKPEERGERYYRKRPCADLVALAAGILEDMLGEEGQVEK